MEQKTGKPQEECDFETAITHTGFGKFNILLLLVAIPTGWTSMLESSTMSYVFPAAQCDLELSLQEKAMLNAVTYIGMICSAFLWGILADNWGRKKLLVMGLLLDSCFIILSGFSQNYSMLLTAKFLGGFVINGPQAAFTAYLAEFHSAKFRTRIIVGRGIVVHSAKFVLPLLAWAVFPLDLHYLLFGGRIVLHSWNIFLFLCAIPALLAGVVYVFMPESPKFLMMKGENGKAMDVLSVVYSLNTGRSKDSYPIKSLLAESAKQEQTGGVNKIKIALKQAGQIFSKKYRWHALLICAIDMAVVFSGNPIRLWLPQIFAAINDYKIHNNGTASLCEILETMETTSSETNTTSTCEVNLSNNFLYVNSLIVAGTCLVGFIISVAVVNIIGKKVLLGSQGICCGIFIAALSFSNSTATTIAFTSLAVTQFNICVSTLFSVVVDLFPTSSRALMLALAMAMSRIGAVVGNLTFPLFLESGCFQAFMGLGSIALVAGLLSILLPNTNFKALE